MKGWIAWCASSAIFPFHRVSFLLPGGSLHFREEWRLRSDVFPSLRSTPTFDAALVVFERPSSTLRSHGTQLFVSSLPPPDLPLESTTHPLNQRQRLIFLTLVRSHYLLLSPSLSRGKFNGLIARILLLQFADPDPPPHFFQKAWRRR